MYICFGADLALAETADTVTTTDDNVSQHAHQQVVGSIGMTATLQQDTEGLPLGSESA